MMFMKRNEIKTGGQKIKIINPTNPINPTNSTNPMNPTNSTNPMNSTNPTKLRRDNEQNKQIRRHRSMAKSKKCS
jgi:hypothetical protein